MATHRALIVALNNYPDPRNALPSCINDAEAIERLLRQAFGFTEFKRAFDADATLDNVARGFDWLFDKVGPDDRRVFYFSGHGYYVKTGDDVDEVICLYDKFLFDNFITARAKDIPAGVFTLISDSCHSGGLDKGPLFNGSADAGGITKFLKVAPPGSPDKAFLTESDLRQVRYRPFGATRRSLAAVGKAFGSLSKDIDEAGQLELNGILMAACLASETASASTAQTAGKSAFTYALIEEVARQGRGTSSKALLAGTATRLRSLGFRQTPVVFEPHVPAGLGSRSFLLFEGAQDGGAVEGTLQSTIQSVISQIFRSKEISMTAHTGLESTGNGAATAQGQDKFLGIVAAIASIAVPAIIDAVRKGGVEQKDFVSAEAQDKFWGALAGIVASALPDVVRALTKGGFTAEKCPPALWPALGSTLGCCIPPLLIEARRAGLQPEKSFDGGEKFWGALGSVIASTLPAIIGALSKSGPGVGKDFVAVGDSQEKFLNILLPLLPTLLPAVVQAISKSGYETQKSLDAGEEKFWGAAIRALSTVAPLVIQALSKSSFDPQKSFDDDKSFWSALGDVVREALPVVVRALSKEAAGPSKAFEPAVGGSADLGDQKFWGALARVVAAAIPTIVGELTKSGQIGPAVDSKSWEAGQRNGKSTLSPSVVARVVSDVMPAARSAWN